MNSARPETTRKGTNITSVVCEESERLALVVTNEPGNEDEPCMGVSDIFIV